MLAKVKTLEGTVIPPDVHYTITRNYGETATEKSNELLLHMMLAIVSVTLLIAFALGRRESIVVAWASFSIRSRTARTPGGGRITTARRATNRSRRWCVSAASSSCECCVPASRTSSC